jgi:MarR family transcriptional regulator, temperature-dependent positive regulator of motility
MTAIPVPSPETGEPADLVEQILDQLEPLIARQRKAVARAGCLRAISSTQLHVLFVLESDGQMPMGRLADLLDASLPNVTGIVDRMVEGGLVERDRDADDRRVVAVRTTAAGRAAVEEIDLVRRRTLGATLARLTPDQQARALQTFTDLRAAAKAADQADSNDHQTTI